MDPVEIFPAFFADPVVDDPDFPFGLGFHRIIGQKPTASAKGTKVGFTRLFQGNLSSFLFSWGFGRG